MQSLFWCLFLFCFLLCRLLFLSPFTEFLWLLFSPLLFLPPSPVNFLLSACVYGVVSFCILCSCWVFLFVFCFLFFRFIFFPLLDFSFFFCSLCRGAVCVCALVLFAAYFFLFQSMRVFSPLVPRSGYQFKSTWIRFGRLPLPCSRYFPASEAVPPVVSLVCCMKPVVDAVRSIYVE